MARKRTKKKAQQGHSQKALLMLTGSALTLCFLSIMYGVLIRQSIAEDKIHGFRIEVLNGTGADGLGSKTATALRQKGIDVFQVENADHFDYKETILIGRKKNDSLAALGQALGCRNVIEQLSDDSFVDATLILGADYKMLKIGIEGDSGLLE